MEHISQLRSVTRHMGSHSVTYPSLSHVTKLFPCCPCPPVCEDLCDDQWWSPQGHVHGLEYTFYSS